mmetsp:Transcript_8571/g.20843  ORF Transcript_8571/g.20843 Transcript_8571/m.20843 type:complete len:291 (-) Transcript_8571:351-1223(-)
MPAGQPKLVAPLFHRETVKSDLLRVYHAHTCLREVVVHFPTLKGGPVRLAAVGAHRPEVEGSTRRKVALEGLPNNRRHAIQLRVLEHGSGLRGYSRSLFEVERSAVHVALASCVCRVYEDVIREVLVAVPLVPVGFVHQLSGEDAPEQSGGETHLEQHVPLLEEQPPQFKLVQDEGEVKKVEKQKPRDQHVRDVGQLVVKPPGEEVDAGIKYTERQEENEKLRVVVQRQRLVVGSGAVLRSNQGRIGRPVHSRELLVHEKDKLWKTVVLVSKVERVGVRQRPWFQLLGRV